MFGWEDQQTCRLLQRRNGGKWVIFSGSLQQQRALLLYWENTTLVFFTIMSRFTFLSYRVLCLPQQVVDPFYILFFVFFHVLCFKRYFCSLILSLTIASWSDFFSAVSVFIFYQFHFCAVPFPASNPLWRPELALVEYSPKTTTDYVEPLIEGILIFLIINFSILLGY